MGRPLNIAFRRSFSSAAWTLIFALGGPKSCLSGSWLPTWFTSQGYNFPLNLITTVAELFIGFLVATAANRAQNALTALLDKIDLQEEQIEATETNIVTLITENTDLTGEIHTLTTEIRTLTMCMCRGTPPSSLRPINRSPRWRPRPDSGSAMSHLYVLPPEKPPLSTGAHPLRRQGLAEPDRMTAPDPAAGILQTHIGSRRSNLEYAQVIAARPRKGGSDEPQGPGPRLARPSMRSRGAHRDALGLCLHRSPSSRGPTNEVGRSRCSLGFVRGRSGFIQSGRPS